MEHLLVTHSIWLNAEVSQLIKRRAIHYERHYLVHKTLEHNSVLCHKHFSVFWGWSFIIPFDGSEVRIKTLSSSLFLLEMQTLNIQALGCPRHGITVPWSPCTKRKRVLPWHSAEHNSVPVQTSAVLLGFCPAVPCACSHLCSVCDSG